MTLSTHFFAQKFAYIKKKQYLCTRFLIEGTCAEKNGDFSAFERSKDLSRSRAVVARQAHNLKVGGSIPSSATL